METVLGMCRRIFTGALTCLVLTALCGCDALIAVNLWVVESPGHESAFAPAPNAIERPEGPVDLAYAEMWSPDGQYMLNRAWPGRERLWELFDVGWNYKRVLIRVYAPGHLPLQAEADTGTSHEPTWGVASLARLDQTKRLEGKAFAEAEAALLAEVKPFRNTGPRNLRELRRNDRLALFYYGQGRAAEANAALEQSLAYVAKARWMGGQERVWYLCLLAENSARNGRLEAARDYFGRAVCGGRHGMPDKILEIGVAVLGAHGQPDATENILAAYVRAADGLNPAFEGVWARRRLGQFYMQQGRLNEAEKVLREARAAASGERDYCLALVLGDLADVLRQMGRNAEAEPLQRQSDAMRRRLDAERLGR
jgi:tetratricopeptide (TPR) repeat protein